MSYVVIAVACLLSLKISSIIFRLFVALIRPFGSIILGFLLGVVVTIGAPIASPHLQTATKTKYPPPKKEAAASPTIELIAGANKLIEGGIALSGRALEEIELAIRDYAAGTPSSEVAQKFWERIS